MELPAELLKRLADMLTTGRVATRNDLLERYPKTITVTRDYFGYANPGVTVDIDATSTGEVAYVKFIPMLKDGCVMLLPAEATDVGAVEFRRSETRHTGDFPMRAALAGFNLDLPETRKLELPVQSTEITLADGTKQTILLIWVKRPTSKKAQSRPRKNKAAAVKSEAPKTEAPKSESTGTETSK